MAKRTSINKKIRFEIFKRDKFTCQYCGKKAPDVVLQVDHICPVAKGGDNDLVNLITSCFDCNSGKRDRTLDDNSVVEKQRKQLELLQKRREQIELMLEWKKSLATFDSEVVDMITDYVNTKIAPLSLNENGKKTVADWVKKFEIDKILDGIDEAAKKYIKSGEDHAIKDSMELFISKVAGVIVVKGMPPVKQKLAYIKGIARNRFGYWDDKKGAIILNEYLAAGRNYGWNEEQLLEDLETEVIPLTKKSDNWTQWKNTLENWTNDIIGWNNRESSQVKEPEEIATSVNGYDDIYCNFCYTDEGPFYNHSLNFNNSSSTNSVLICIDCLEQEKQKRGNAEENLLAQLRLKKFSCGEVSQIAEAFKEMSNFHITDVMATVISKTLQNESTMRALCDKYFEELASKRNSSEVDDLPF